MVVGILVRTQAVVRPANNRELGVGADNASGEATVWQEAEVGQAGHMHRFVHGTGRWSGQPVSTKFKEVVLSVAEWLRIRFGRGGGGN